MGYLGTKPQTATTLADNIVTADKIVSGAVTDAKIAAMAATKLTGTVPDANAPSGSVIQVVGTLLETSQTTTSNTFAAVSSFSVSITPSSTSSKILILMTGWGTVNNSGVHGIATIYRNSTNLNGNYGNNFYTSGGGYSEFAIPLSYLDSPATTSATTYQIYIRQDNAGSFTFGNNGGNRRCSLIAMEIAG